MLDDLKIYNYVEPVFLCKMDILDHFLDHFDPLLPGRFSKGRGRLHTHYAPEKSARLHFNAKSPKGAAYFQQRISVYLVFLTKFDDAVDTRYKDLCAPC